MNEILCGVNLLFWFSVISCFIFKGSSSCVSWLFHFPSLSLSCPFFFVCVFNSFRIFCNHVCVSKVQPGFVECLFLSSSSSLFGSFFLPCFFCRLPLILNNSFNLWKLTVYFQPSVVEFCIWVHVWETVLFYLFTLDRARLTASTHYTQQANQLLAQASYLAYRCESHTDVRL